MRKPLLFLCALALLLPPISAQITPAASLLALSKQDHTLSIVDPASLKILATIPVGDDPHEVIASTDGKTAYVSNYGFGAFHTLAVIDLVGHMRQSSIDLGALRGPHGLDFKLGKVWFTAEAAKAIGSYDPVSAQIDWIMGTGQDRTHMIYVFPDGKRIVTTNVNAATVTIMEKTEGRPGGPPPGMGPGGPPPQRSPAREDPLPALRRHLPAATGNSPSSPSDTALKVSMFPPMAKRCGWPTPKTAPSPSSISPRRR